VKRAHWISLLLTLFGAVAWFFLADTSAPPENATVEQPKAIAPSSKVSQKPVSAPIVEQKQQEQVELAEQFQLVASAYAAELETPSYSKPLLAGEVNAAEFVPQQVPLEGGGSVAIVPSKYRFSFPESIQAELVATGISLSEVTVAIRNEWTGEELLQQALQPQDGRWLIDIKPGKDWDGQLELAVDFQARSDSQTLRTGIEYSQPVAWVLSVADSFGEGADLVIPLQLDVLVAGDYRVRAQLFTDTGQPLAALTQEKKLSQGKQTLDLKAYKSVLQQHSGNFVLKALFVEKRPSKPGDLTRYGASKEPEFVVSAFAIGQLSDEKPVVTEEEQQRLEFLKQMSHGR
jgi:hypothetical protein